MKLIRGNKEVNDSRRSAKDEMVRDAFLKIASKSLRKAFDDKGKIVDRSELKKSIYGFVRTLNMVNSGDAEDKFRIYQPILSIMGKMTPRELIETFPVTKEYRRHKYEMKDYFTVMECINANYPMDKPIVPDSEDTHETMFKFLMEYSNVHTDRLAIAIMMNISDLHRMNTGRDMLDNFMISQGKKPLKKHYLCEGADGKQFMVDEDGKSFPVKQSKPRYLKGV